MTMGTSAFALVPWEMMRCLEAKNFRNARVPHSSRPLLMLVIMMMVSSVFIFLPNG